MKIGIIDYGVGNLSSVARAAEEIGATTTLIDHPKDIQNVDKVILPGVGNFADCASRLANNGWISTLQDEVLGKKKPLLGICLGMQLLASSSMEGADLNNTPCTGLDFIPGRVLSLRELGSNERLPHVGWNSVYVTDTNSDMFDGVPTGTDFYFVHKFGFIPDNKNHTKATTDYGCSFSTAVQFEHIWGVQFHPEKSSLAGFRFLHNFLNLS